MQQYAVNYDKLLCEFLEIKNIKFFVTDADIIGINIDDINDTFFTNLIIEYSNWLNKKTKTKYSYTIQQCPGYEGHIPKSLGHEVCKNCGSIKYYH